LDRADAVYDAGPPSAAIPLYAALAKDHADLSPARTALYMAGFASLGAGDYAAAGRYADSFLKSYPDADLANDARYVAAEAKLLGGDYPTAVKLYDALLAGAASRADVPAWKLRRATALLLEKRYPEVISALASQSNSFPAPEEKRRPIFLVGSAQLELREAEPAAKELTAALSAAPKWRQADETLLQLAAAQRRMNKLSEAIATARKVGVEFPDSRNLDRAFCRVGEYCYAAGDYRASAEAFRQILARWPDSPLTPYPWYGLGWDELELGQAAPAEEAFTKVIDWEAKHAPDAKSAKDAKSSLAPQAYSGRARARQALQKHAEAIADAQTYLKSGPKGAERSDALFVEAISNAALGKSAAAATAFQSILSEDPAYTAGPTACSMSWPGLR